MGEIRPKRCEGRELTKDQLARARCGQFLLGALLVLLGWGWTLTGR